MAGKDSLEVFLLSLQVHQVNEFLNSMSTLFIAANLNEIFRDPF